MRRRAIRAVHMLVKKENVELWKHFVESAVWLATGPRGQRGEDEYLL